MNPVARTKRTRRVKFGEDDGSDDKEPRKQTKKKNKETPKGDKYSYVPFMPKCLFATFNSEAKTNFSKWRQLTKQRETMEKKHLETSSEEVVKDTDKPSKKDGKKNGKQDHRVTRTCRVGIQDGVVQIKLTSSDEEYIRTIFSESTKALPITVGDDSNDQYQFDYSNDYEEGHSTRVRALKRTTSVGMSKGTIRHQPFAVIDPGADMDVIGRVGWKVLHFSNKSETLGGALKGMGTELLPSVDAVTSVEDMEGRVILLDIRNAAYDRRITQNKSLWNSHHMRANKVQVSDAARDQGGDKCLRIKDKSGSWITIPLKFNGDIMTIDLREPTEDEKLALRVNWLTPPMEDITPQSI